MQKIIGGALIVLLLSAFQAQAKQTKVVCRKTTAGMRCTSTPLKQVKTHAFKIIYNCNTDEKCSRKYSTKRSAQRACQKYWAKDEACRVISLY